MSQAHKKVIFNASEVASRLRALKQAAIESGKEDSEWWAPALNFEWSSVPRKGNNGTQWMNVNYTDASGVKGKLVVRINGEKHVGQIMPNDAAEAAELAARTKNPNVKIAARTKKAAMQINQWNAVVKTEEDGITVCTDADGAPILPSDDKRSNYFAVASYVSEAFTSETRARVMRGEALVAKVAEMKKDKSVTAQAIIDAFGPRSTGDIILSHENVMAIRRLFPSQKDTDSLTKGAIVTSIVKIASLIQEYVSNTSAKNANCPLPNPITRIAMDFDDLGVAQVMFHDKKSSYIVDGKQKYEVGKVNGEPVNVNNVHLFMLSRSLVDGIVDLGSICFSSSGISMPVKLKVAVVEHPEMYGVGLDDVYDDAAPPDMGAAAAATAAPPDALVPSVAPADNYEDLLNDLKGIAP